MRESWENDSKNCANVRHVIGAALSCGSQKCRTRCRLEESEIYTSKTDANCKSQKSLLQKLNSIGILTGLGLKVHTKSLL